MTIPCSNTHLHPLFKASRFSRRKGSTESATYQSSVKSFNVLHGMDAIPATSSRKRTRLVAGCASCRERHLKCDSILPKCRQCQVHDTECNREVKLRFRHELSTGGPIGESFPTSQKWMTQAAPLRYYDETPDIVRFYDDILFEDNAPPGTMINVVQEDPTLAIVPQPADNSFQTSPDPRIHDHHDFAHPAEPRITATDTRPPSYQESPPYATTPAPINSNQINVSLGKESPASLPSYHSSSIHLTPHQDQFEPFTDREADLMRNFTENMALWVDVTDVERHFEIEVPRRALSNTMLRYAIFSFSSRHLNRNIHKFDSEEALDYRNKALQLLIPQLSGPVEGLTEEHLAAVVIMRLDEEMDIEDTQSHLAGATKILNSMSSFSSSGGLGEACAWLCLRQDIYISLDSQQPLRTRLENFYNSLWLRKDDDMSWSNKMVLLLAKILSHAFQDRSVERASNLKRLSDQVEEWEQNKPLSFRAIKTIPRGKERGQRLPVIWMLSPFHVLGTQYYHIAKIVMLLSVDQDSRNNTGFKNYQQSRRIEKTIREHLLTILGLAISNPRAENTLFQARHALAIWGGVLRHQLDQEAATDFLRFMQDRTGWNMSKAMDALCELWHEDSD